MRRFIVLIGFAGLLHAVLSPFGLGISTLIENGWDAGEGLLTAAAAFGILFFWNQSRPEGGG